MKHIIRNWHGQIITDTNENQERFDSKSLDEEDIKEKAERLQAGGSITAVFSDDSKVSVTFDNKPIIKLVSKIDKSEHPVQLSWVAGSALVAVGMKHGKGKEEKRIELKSTGQEIKMFLDFLLLEQE